MSCQQQQNNAFDASRLAIFVFYTLICGLLMSHVTLMLDGITSFEPDEGRETETG